jgi:hypothetical protein
VGSIEIRICFNPGTGSAQTPEEQSYSHVANNGKRFYMQDFFAAGLGAVGAIRFKEQMPEGEHIFELLNLSL